jgi:hypothetical protein
VPSLAAAFAFLRRQGPKVRILSGAPSNFSGLGLHRPIPVCANSSKTHQKLEWRIGLPAREVRVAQMEPLLRNGRIERVWGRKNHSAGSPVTIAEIASHRRCRTIAASTSTGHDLSIRSIEDSGDNAIPRNKHMRLPAGPALPPGKGGRLDWRWRRSAPVHTALDARAPRRGR